jgi:hypothetical protein
MEPTVHVAAAPAAPECQGISESNYDMNQAQGGISTGYVRADHNPAKHNHAKDEEPAKRGASMDLAEKLTKKKAVHTKSRNPVMAVIVRWNFFRSVLTHLIVTSLVAAGIMKAVNDNLSYLDCLFLTVSAVTGTGLATVAMRDLTLGGGITLFVLMLLGSNTLIQLMALLFRM